MAEDYLDPLKSTLFTNRPLMSLHNRPSKFSKEGGSGMINYTSVCRTLSKEVLRYNSLKMWILGVMLGLIFGIIVTFSMAYYYKKELEKTVRYNKNKSLEEVSLELMSMLPDSGSIIYNTIIDGKITEQRFENRKGYVLQDNKKFKKD